MTERLVAARASFDLIHAARRRGDGAEVLARATEWLDRYAEEPGDEMELFITDAISFRAGLLMEDHSAVEATQEALDAILERFTANTTPTVAYVRVYALRCLAQFSLRHDRFDNAMSAVRELADTFVAEQTGPRAVSIANQLIDIGGILIARDHDEAALPFFELIVDAFGAADDLAYLTCVARARLYLALVFLHLQTSDRIVEAILMVTAAGEPAIQAIDQFVAGHGGKDWRPFDQAAALCLQVSTLVELGRESDARDALAALQTQYPADTVAEPIAMFIASVESDLLETYRKTDHE